MIALERHYKSQPLCLDACRMGNDLNVSVYGGKVPHIGGVVMGFMSPALHEADRLTYTEQVVSLQGHKDVELARPVAKKLAKALECTVVAACGVHYPNILMEDIPEIEQRVMDMVAELIAKLSTSNAEPCE
ncbi:prenylated flavin chaperone LpdD [Endozoicomonadaceae bacterium StTr2]